MHFVAHLVNEQHVLGLFCAFHCPEGGTRHGKKQYLCGMKKVGLFIDTWYPMVDGVIKVVDNYARRLTKYCDVVVFCPETRGYSKEDDEKLPYKVVRCNSFPLINNDYDVPTPALDPLFEARLIKSGIDLVHIHSPFSVGLAGVLYGKIHRLWQPSTVSTSRILRNRSSSNRPSMLPWTA